MSPKDGAAVVKNTTAPREKTARVQAVQAPPGRVTSSFVVKQLVVDGLLSAADAERFKITGGSARSGHPLVVLAEMNYRSPQADRRHGAHRRPGRLAGDHLRHTEVERTD